MKAGLNRDRGFTSVSFMLMMMVLIIAVGAISVDLWHLVAEHREVAGVVDGAAISAANAIDEGALRLDPPFLRLRSGEARGRACNYLLEYGGVGACPGPNVDIDVYVDTVSITMRREVSLTLLRVLSGLNPDVDASAIEVAATSTAGIGTR